MSCTNRVVNLNDQKNNRELWIGIGFGLEVLVFLITGIFMQISIIGSFFMLLCGVGIAYNVGKIIEENAVENFKWGLK